MAGLRWGIKTAPQHTTYDALCAVWREADQTPTFEHAWLFDHFAPIQGDLNGPCFEGWTLLAALAAQTSRVRVGLMVAGNTYRHPAVHAHMAATVDVISGGRLDFGLGAGWNEYEHASMGIPLYAPGEPKPMQKPHPPFVIGGGGEQLTLRVAARYADVWNSTSNDPEAFGHKVRVLHGHCAAVGRDPSQIELSVQTRVNYDDLPATVAILKPLVAAGATHLVLMLTHPYPEGIVARLADEVVAKIG